MKINQLRGKRIGLTGPKILLRDQLFAFLFLIKVSFLISFHSLPSVEAEINRITVSKACEEWVFECGHCAVKLQIGMLMLFIVRLQFFVRISYRISLSVRFTYAGWSNTARRIRMRISCWMASITIIHLERANRAAFARMAVYRWPAEPTEVHQYL